MKTILSSILIVLLSFTSLSAQNSSDIPDLLNKQYEQFKEKEIQTRRFKHEDITPLIDQLEDETNFSVRRVGTSVEGRSLRLISLGEGDTDIFFWSQMHGNESTATAAIFDLMNFFREPGDALVELRDRILENATLHFLPMLNPDGAERFRRYNALDIDVNRDALRLTTPEGATLKKVRDSLEADFGFNLHDQSTYYTAGRSSEPATISFLAPAYDYEQSVNEVRQNAMKLIVQLNDMLQNYIPGQVAKYSDAHEPRAFGDMIQKWGTSTILIESGGFQDDPEKQYIRKLNFILLITAADAIGKKSYADQPVDEYFEIPENEVHLHDLIIRNLEIKKEDELFTVDLAIRHSENEDEDHRRYRYSSRIAEIGDLSTYYGYNELDGKGLIASPGKVHPDTLESIEALRQINPANLLNDGYTGIVLQDLEFDDNQKEAFSSYPLNLIMAEGYENSIGLGHTPNIVLKDEEDQVRYVVINGFLYNPKTKNVESIENGLIVK